MKKIFNLILISSTVLLSCQTTRLAESDNLSLLLKDAVYLNAASSSVPLDSAEEYLAAIEDNEALKIEWEEGMREDPEWQAAWSYQNNFYRFRKVKLIGDLNKNFPGTADLEELMLQRFEDNEIIYRLDIREEVKEYSRTYRDKPSQVEEAWYHYADGIISRSYRKEEPILTAVNEFIDRFPNSEHSDKLFSKALSFLRDTEGEETLKTIILDKMPDGSTARGIISINNIKALQGRLFNLEFTDCVTETEIDLADWRGKVVVVDFWATWCAPCRAELPEMKKIYNEYHSKGIEFVGISLDREEETLKSFCLRNEIPWPQYCAEAPGGDPYFDESWGITGIPTIFILDKEGRVYSVEARGRVEELINELM